MGAHTRLVAMLWLLAAATTACTSTVAGQAVPAVRDGSNDQTGAGSFTVFGQHQMERDITNLVENTYKDVIRDVTCPARQPVISGTTFTCSAVVNGSRTTVRITVVGDRGKYTVSPPN